MNNNFNIQENKQYGLLRGNWNSNKLNNLESNYPQMNHFEQSNPMSDDWLDGYGGYGGYEGYEGYTDYTGYGKGNEYQEYKGNNSYMSENYPKYQFVFPDLLNNNNNDLEKNLIIKPIDIKFIQYLKSSFDVNTILFISILFFMFTISLCEQLKMSWSNTTNIKSGYLEISMFSICGFIINLMVGIICYRIPLSTGLSDSDANCNLSTINVNIIPIEKKMLLVLVSIGISCELSWLSFFLNSWTNLIIISLIVSVGLFGYLLHIKLTEFEQSIQQNNQVTNIDINLFYQDEIPIMLKKSLIQIICCTTLIYLFVDFKFLGFVLIVLTNLLIGYVYYWQIKKIIKECEEFFSIGLFDITRVVLSNLIIFYQHVYIYTSNVLKKLFG